MKKTVLLCSAIVAVLLGSSFTQVNSNKLQELDLADFENIDSIDKQLLKGTRDNIIVGTSATAFPGDLNNITTSSQTKVIIDPGTGTTIVVDGGTTKLEKLLESY